MTGGGAYKFKEFAYDKYEANDNPLEIFSKKQR